jgi:hypothetical protein
LVRKKHLPEEQRLMRIVVKLDVVGGSAVRLDDADGVNERRGNRLDRIEGKRLIFRYVERNREGGGRERKGRAGDGTWEEAWVGAEEAMQEEREKDAREPSLEAAARRTSGSESSGWSKKTARKRVRQERSRSRRMPRRYAASSHSRASVPGCACACACAAAPAAVAVTVAISSSCWLLLLLE